VAVVAALGTVLAAAYSLRVARTVWAGDRTEPFIDDSSNSEWDVVAVLVVAALVLGIAPGPLLAITSDAVSTIVRAAP
jgi:NADH-quinone oxidoreductase subunit M